MPKNITIDLRLWSASGIGKYLQNIVPSVIEEFKDINFTLLGNKKSLSAINWPSNVIAINAFDSKIYSIEEQYKALKVIPKNCDLLWWPHWNIPIFYKGKIITTIYDAFHLRIPVNFKNFFKNIYTRLLFNFVRKKSLLTFTLSNFSKTELTKLTKINPKNIHITNLAVDKEWFNFQPDRNKIDSIHPYIVYVGNVKPHKNLITLVESYIKILDKVEHNLLIIGKKEGFISGDKVVQKYANLYPDRIKFTGWIEDIDVRNYVANADLMVFPTLYEGFGIPPLEAMACGCPVLVSDIAVTREVCSDAAIFFDPNNSEELSKSIINILSNSDHRNKMHSKGVERSKYFSWESSANKTIFRLSQLFLEMSKK